MTPEFALDGLKAIAGWVGSVVTSRQNNAEKKDAKTDAALASLMKAALETRHYMGLIRDNPQLRNHDKEQNIANLWSDAGLYMSHVNPELAMRYLLKADYWSDTKGWTSTEENERLIKLDDILRLSREVLLA